MPTLRDDVIKLAHDNPGPIREALLPILAAASPRGKAQTAIMAQIAKWPVGTKMPLTDMRIPFQVGGGFGGLMKGAEALGKKGLIGWDGVRVHKINPGGAQPPKFKLNQDPYGP